jgi:intracellular multiplication protein IcmE
MKNPLANIKGKFGEVKGRTLLLVVVVIVIFIIAAVFSLRKSENPLLGGGSTANSRAAAVKAPSIESTPGIANVSDKSYIELQKQANQQKADVAIQKGTSAVATVTSDQFVPELTIPEPGMASIAGGAAGTTAQQTAAAAAAKQNAALEQYQKVYEEQMLREQEREQQRIREQEVQQEEAYMDAFEGLMQAQIKGLMTQWKPSSQTYVRNAAEGGTGEKPTPTNPGLPPMYKAGDIIFGVMETSVNSDEPGPVMAQVVSGPLAGSKLLGSFRRVEDQVFIEFTLLSAPEVSTSLPVKAVAIDPETARTALATSVDHHRLLRYSTLFASAFLQGMGDAVLAGIQPDFTLEGDNTLTVNSVTVGTRDQVIVGLGEVGRKAGEKMDKFFDMPPTVTVDSGTAVGLMFLQDFSLHPGSPTVQVVDTTAPVQAYPSASSYAGQSTSAPAGTPVVNALSQPTSTVNTQ